MFKIPLPADPDGYTSKELKKYIPKKLKKKFDKIFGIQTCLLKGTTVYYYKQDVERALAGLPPLD